MRIQTDPRGNKEKFMVSMQKNKWVIKITGALAVSLFCAMTVKAAEVDDLTVNEDATDYGSLIVTQELATGSVPTTNQAAYYNFYQNETNIVTDQSGNNNTGTVVNATWTASGKVVGGACEFDGSGDYVEITSDALNFNSNLTIAFWYKNDSTSGAHSPLSKRPDVVFCDWLFLFNKDYGTVGLYASTSGSGWATAIDVESSTAMDNSQWHHWAYSQNGTTGIMYIDGSEVGSDTSAATGINSNKINIGRGQSSANYWDGKMDEVLLYDRALSSNEVYNLYLYSGTNFMAPTAVIDGDATFNHEVTLEGGATYVERSGDVSMGCFDDE